MRVRCAKLYLELMRRLGVEWKRIGPWMSTWKDNRKVIQPGLLPFRIVAYYRKLCMTDSKMRYNDRTRARWLRFIVWHALWITLDQKNGMKQLANCSAAIHDAGGTYCLVICAARPSITHLLHTMVLIPYWACIKFSESSASCWWGRSVAYKDEKTAGYSSLQNYWR